MNTPQTRGTLTLLVAAGLALAAGAAMLGSALFQAAAVRARIDEVRDMFTIMAEARSELQALDVRHAVFDPDRSEPDTPAALYEQFFSPEEDPSEWVRRESPENMASGRFHRMEWLFDNALADQALAFAAACEKNRPPWRVESIRLTAAPGAAGRVSGGIVLLRFEPKAD